MRLHLLAIPHTVTRGEFSHCAFTQKVRRFGPMMRATGYRVIHYGVAGSEAHADEDVVLMDQDEHLALLGHAYHETGAGFYGDDAQDGSALYRQWNLYAREALKARVEPGDCILLPFGHAHAAAIRGLPVLAAGASAIESGIGYYDCLLPWRIYESYAARHAAMGREGRHGVSRETTRLEFVVPNYYDITEWPAGDGSGDYIAFMARLTKGKGLDIVLDVARARPDVAFKIAGQGNIDAWELPPNVEYVGVLRDVERAAFLGKARALMNPSTYVEPFGGAVVEAALCGTPSITTDFGAFVETVRQHDTGIRGTVLQDFVRAVDDVRGLSRGRIRARAQQRYGTHAIGQRYAEVFDTVADATRAGRFPATGW